MSIFFSLALALLCFSYHACNARSFGVVHKEPTNEFQQSISQKNEKLDPARVSTQSDMKSSTQNDSRSAEIKVEFEELESGNSKSNNELRNDIVVEEGEEVEVSSSTQTVIWRVPDHKKKGEQEPGFNLDYLPPKTHPPAHN